MKSHPSSLLLSISLVLAACGGGGSGGGGGGAGAAFALHVDTAAGGSDAITAHVSAVVFEAVDGSSTPNLLPAPVDVTLVDPTGGTVGFALRAPSQPGAVAIHLLIDGASVTALRADGSLATVSLPGSDLRIPLSGAFTPGSAAPVRISHASAPSLTPLAGGGLAWTPSLSASVVGDVILDIADATVMSVDGALRSMIVTLSGYQDLSFGVRIPATANLVGDDGAGRSRDDFLGECRSGSRISFEGISRSSREIEVHSAHHHGAVRGELKLLGRIASIDVGTSSFVMDVQAAIRRGIPVDIGTASVTVDASSAVIYASHHSMHSSASFGDLAIGALVEVEGHNPVAGTMSARSVELEDDHGQHQPGEIEGAVVGVDLNAGTITVGPRGNDPLLLGGVQVPSATIEVDGSTAILRRNSSALVAIALGGVDPGDRIWVRGSITAPQVVHADWVRVEAR